jgi:hypothetical protein
MDILKQLFPTAQGMLGKGLYFFGLMRMIHALYVTVRWLPCVNISIFLRAMLQFLCAGGLNSESPLGRIATVLGRNWRSRLSYAELPATPRYFVHLISSLKLTF